MNSPVQRRGGTFALAVGLMGLVGVALGFEAGRRYPFEFLRRPAAAPRIIGWDSLAALAPARYENQTAVVDGHLYVFNGFLNFPDAEATPRVDRFDPSTGEWSRLGDVPNPTTHRQAAIAGDTVWFAGGFQGQSPGPATSETWGYVPSTDSWFPGPPLPSPRAGGGFVHHAGRLHYFGGFGPDRQAALGEHLVLDLAAAAAGRGEWRVAAPLPTPRGHLSGVVLDGFIYAIGGAIRHDPRQSTRRSVHRYDPTADRWTEVSPLPAPRSHFEGSTFTFGGRIGIVGGWNLTAEERAVSDVSFYNPQSDRWTTVLHMPINRFGATAAVIGDSLLAGFGSIDLQGPLNSSFWLHRLTPTWLPGDPLPVPTGEGVGGVLGEHLFVVGNTRPTLGYDLRTGRWEQRERYAARPVLSGGHSGQAFDGRLYLVGGRGLTQRLVQIFDPEENEWSFGPDLPFGTMYPVTAELDGQLYVAGGIDDETVIGSAARLDPETGVWTELAPMPFPRVHAGSATDGVRLFVFGGQASASPTDPGTVEVQIYDPRSDSWTVSHEGGPTAAPLPEPRARLGKAVVQEGKFWFLGSIRWDGSAGRLDDRVLIYDPLSGSWTTGPRFLTPRHSTMAVLYEGNIYLAGGGERPRAARSSRLEIFRLPVAP